MTGDTISRAAALDALNGCTEIYLNNLPPTIYKEDAIKALKAQPSATDTNVAPTDTISRQAALDALGDIDCSDGVGFSTLKYDAINDAVTAIKALPYVQPEPEEFEWCHTCREYDQENHCCHRWTKVIRQTV